jgi:hypothetical protein
MNSLSRSSSLGLAPIGTALNQAQGLSPYILALTRKIPHSFQKNAKKKFIYFLAVRKSMRTLAFALGREAFFLFAVDFFPKIVQQKPALRRISICIIHFFCLTFCTRTKPF